MGCGWGAATSPHCPGIPYRWFTVRQPDRHDFEATTTPSAASIETRARSSRSCPDGHRAGARRRVGCRCTLVREGAGWAERLTSGHPVPMMAAHRPRSSQEPPVADPAPPHVFVSYASADHARVLPVVTALERAGVRAWIDRSGIAGGANYGPEIVAAIRESGALLVCCSAAAFASRNVRQEVALAWKHERPILPLLLERVAALDDLAYWLEAAQWVEVLDRGEGDWLPEVLRGLERLGVAPDPPTPPAREDEGVPLAAVRLPTPLTDLLGRDAEVRDAAALLAGHRLVTLTGPGGVGKTRLAIEAARAASPSFPDGVTFVDLSALRAAELVLPTIAQSLGAHASAGQSLDDALADHIGERRYLLVLDNFEQVVDASPAVAALLVRCASLGVLATS